jgi:hypothetical protein
MMIELILGGIAAAVMGVLGAAWAWRADDHTGTDYWGTVQTVGLTIVLVLMILLIVGGVVAVVAGIASTVLWLVAL